MARNLEEEMDCLKAEVSEIKGMLQEFMKKGGDTGPSGRPAESPITSVGMGEGAGKAGCAGAAEGTAEGPKDCQELISSVRDGCPDKESFEKLNQLFAEAEAHGSTGKIFYYGVFGSGGRSSYWTKDGVDTDDLLRLMENHTAEKVLNCLGNSDRLNILLAILKKPMSVAGLVKECGLNTTGQVYHHMKPLLAADLIVEDSMSEGKGIYVVQPHKVQGIIMLLAGICDMVDETYTKGNWS